MYRRAYCLAQAEKQEKLAIWARRARKPVKAAVYILVTLNLVALPVLAACAGQILALGFHTWAIRMTAEIAAIIN